MIAQSVGLLFSTASLNFDKKSFGLHFGQFFTNSSGHPGVDVMITIFGDFCLFSAKKIGVFLKNQCYDQILEKN
jgi:hypothetical protein